MIKCISKTDMKHNITSESYLAGGKPVAGRGLDPKTIRY